jgi:hypothetical protein
MREDAVQTRPLAQITHTTTPVEREEDRRREAENAERKDEEHNDYEEARKSGEKRTWSFPAFLASSAFFSSLRSLRLCGGCSSSTSCRFSS